MNEVDIGAVLDPRHRLARHDAVPPHVWNLEPRITRHEPLDAAAQEAEPGAVALLAMLEQHLKPEADAEVRHTSGDALDENIGEAALGQAAHEDRERALPGHDEL